MIRYLEDVTAAGEPAQRLEPPVKRPAGGRSTVEVEDVERQVDRRQIGRERRAGGKTAPQGGQVWASLGVEDRDDAVEHRRSRLRGDHGLGDVREPAGEIGERLALEANGPGRIEKEQ